MGSICPLVGSELWSVVLEASLSRGVSLARGPVCQPRGMSRVGCCWGQSLSPGTDVQQAPDHFLGTGRSPAEAPRPGHARLLLRGYAPRLHRSTCSESTPKILSIVCYRILVYWWSLGGKCFDLGAPIAPPAIIDNE